MLWSSGSKVIDKICHQDRERDTRKQLTSKGRDNKNRALYASVDVCVCVVVALEPEKGKLIKYWLECTKQNTKQENRRGPCQVGKYLQCICICLSSGSGVYVCMCVV